MTDFYKNNIATKSNVVFFRTRSKKYMQKKLSEKIKAFTILSYW